MLAQELSTETKPPRRKLKQPGAMSREQLEAFLFEIRDEPLWRREADIAAEYYDGNQLDSETLSQMQDRGIAPLVRNLIGPTVDVILGMEAKNKRDWIILPDEDDNTDLADALTKALRDAERQSRADRACSDAYASQVKSGLGWVEVQNELDPFKSPYRVKNVHRREVFWDFRSVEPDLSDARYLVRKKWYDVDILQSVFPNHAQLIDFAGSEWADWDPAYWTDGALEYGRAFDQELRTGLDDMEWRDTERRRMLLYEVWYRVVDRGFILRLPDGTVVEFDRSNPRHVEAVEMGLLKPESSFLTRMRLAWWIGPHQLVDIPSPYPHNKFPYVPFWGYREDSTGIPYGLVRRMMSPQDEVNARLSKMMWLLSAKRIIMDEDAITGTMTMAQLLREAARPDAVVVLNKNRRNVNGFEIAADRDMSQQQFNVLKDAQVSLQDVAGVHQAILGKETAAESGVAINNLVEQGSTTLAEMNDNFRYGKTSVGELLTSLVKQRLGSSPHQIMVERHGKKVPIGVNQIVQNPDGSVSRSNDISRTRSQVALEEIPNTPTYRTQVFTQLTELTKSLPPDIQAMVMDIVVEASDLPIRKELSERIKQVTGQQNEEDLTPEETQAKREQEEQQQRAQQLEMDEQQSKIEQSDAKTEKLLAEVKKIMEEIQAQQAEQVENAQLDQQMERLFA